MIDLEPVTHYIWLCITCNLDIRLMFLTQETNIQKIPE